MNHVQPAGNEPCADLFLLRDDVIFLNHGSFGACPRPVFARFQAWQRELEEDPVEFLGRRFQRLMDESRGDLAAYVGAGKDDIAYVANATTGLNIIARSLPLAAGDEVLATDHEYGALDRTWRFICAKRGADYKRMHVSLPIMSRERVIDEIWSGVTPQTRVLFLSHITSPTAIILPIEELIARARERGIITVIDGAHAPGQIDLSLNRLGADFYVGNCHKWMMAPKGSGFLHARREGQQVIEPLVVSWGYESEKPGPSRLIDYTEWQGTRDISAFLAVPAAMEFMRDHGWDEVQERSHELLRRFRQQITDLTGLAPITPDRKDSYAQMAAFPLPPCDGESLQRAMYEEYHTEVPITLWDNQSFIRVSVQAYNDQDDLDALIAGLEELLPKCKRGSH